MIKQAFLQIIDAVVHCHSIGIYHRDLKCEDILATEEGLTVKLVDLVMPLNKMQHPIMHLD